MLTFLSQVGRLLGLTALLAYGAGSIGALCWLGNALARG